MALNSKGGHFDIIINPPKEKATRETLEAYQNAILLYNGFNFVATIIHDSDKNEARQPKTIHAHFYIRLTEEPKDKIGHITCKTMLDTVMDLTEITDKNQISIEVAKSDIGSVQYLTHQNKPNKTRYDRKLILSTDKERLDKWLDGTIEKAKEEPTDEQILRAIKLCPTYESLCLELTLKTAQRVLPSFKQIKSEQKTDYYFILGKLKTIRNRLKELVNLLGTLKNYREANLELPNRYYDRLFETLTHAKDVLENTEDYSFQELFQE